MVPDFTGRVAVVTGASSGLGAVTVRRLVAATRRLMGADDVAAAICFSASDDAPAVNGSIQVVDAARTAG